MPRLAHAALVTPAALLLAACSLEPAVDEGATGASASAIIGGTSDTGDPGVVLVIAQSQAQGESLCTGEVVSPHVVLTAAHCVDPSVVGPGNTFYVFRGDDVTSPQQSKDKSLFFAVKETHFDPQFNVGNLSGGHDVAVVVTKSAMPMQPLPMNRSPLTTAMKGKPLRLVGYGVSSGSDKQGATAGIKRQVMTTLAGYNALLLQFTDGSHNTCEGDSGGPGFMMVNGVETIVGITSFGPSGCQQGGVDTRVDVYAAAFVDPYIAMFDPNGGPTPDMAQPKGSPDLAKPPSPDLLSPDPGPDMTGPAQGDPAPDLARPAHPASPDAGSSTGGAGNASVGDHCTRHADCRDHVCATWSEGSFCTRACDPLHDGCPLGYVCGAVDSEHLCVPATAYGNGLRAQSGCSVGPGAGGTAASTGAALAVGLAALALVAARRRRRG